MTDCKIEEDKSTYIMSSHAVGTHGTVDSSRSGALPENSDVANDTDFFPKCCPKTNVAIDTSEIPDEINKDINRSNDSSHAKDKVGLSTSMVPMITNDSTSDNCGMFNDIAKSSGVSDESTDSYDAGVHLNLPASSSGGGNPENKSYFFNSNTTNVSNELDQRLTHELVSVKSEVDSEITEYSRNAEHVLTLFPFVCGVCDLKCNSIVAYMSHFQMHENVNKYLHCCLDNEKELKTGTNTIYFCSVCGLGFPTLCTLYTHLINDEAVTDFIFKGNERTAYIKTVNNTNNINHCKDNSHTNMKRTKWRNKKKLSSKSSGSKWKRDKLLQSDSNPKLEEELTIDYQTLDRITERSIKHAGQEDENVDHQKNGRIANSNTIQAVKENHDRNVVKEDFTINYHTASEKITEYITNALNDITEDMTEDTADNSYSVVPEEEQLPTTKDTKRGRHFPCEICGKMLKYGSLSGHKASHEKHIYPCDQCNLKFQSKSWLHSHKVQVHVTDKKFTCHECGKSFKALPSLRQHSKTHLTERTIQCPECPKMFLYKNVLRIHMLTHSVTTPHHCDICGKGFKRHYDIVEHKEGVHEAVEKYECSKCQKRFTTKKSLNRHSDLHLPPKHFCTVCGKSFVRASNLRTHMKVHRTNPQ